jgi:hypothetical protein
VSATRYIAKCKACGCVSSGLLVGNVKAPQSPYDLTPPGVVHYHPRTGSLSLVCRKCGVSRVAKAVRGVYSAQHECSAKCMSSTGTVCECSCAGRNHGGAYAAA